MMKSYHHLIFCATLWCNIAYAEVSVSLLVTPKYTFYSADTLFDVPETFIEKPTLTSDNTLELTGDLVNRIAELNYLFSMQTLLSNTSSPETKLGTNELVVSKGVGNWDFSFGRRRESWGVGYGFRPLDVVQRYDQQTTSRRSVIGKDRLSVEYFFNIASWTLMWVNPMQHNNKQQQNEAIVSKFSTSTNNYDLHLISQFSKKNKLQLGVGGINIVSNAWSLYGSLLFTQQYQKKLHRLIDQSNQFLVTEDPYISRNYKNGLQTTLGLNWSNESKHNIIAEYWYNDLAYSPRQWQKQFELTKQQQSLLEQTTLPKTAIYGNIAWMASATQTRQLAQHNLMLRWNYDAEYWKPTFYIIMATIDKSNMITLTANRTYHSFTIESGIRLFNGTNDSVYGGLIISKLFYINVLRELW